MQPESLAGRAISGQPWVSESAANDRRTTDQLPLSLTPTPHPGTHSDGCPAEVSFAIKSFWLNFQPIPPAEAEAVTVGSAVHTVIRSES
jgi:hypothetical protein